MITEPIYRTKIIPLRWFANMCNHLAMYPFGKALRQSDIAEDNGWENVKLIGHIWWNLHRIINYPYEKWGTSYRVISWEFDGEEGWTYFGVNTVEDWDTID
jgi:hypothetical protein